MITFKHHIDINFIVLVGSLIHWLLGQKLHACKVVLRLTYSSFDAASGSSFWVTICCNLPAWGSLYSSLSASCKSKIALYLVSVY